MNSPMNEQSKITKLAVLAACMFLAACEGKKDTLCQSVLYSENNKPAIHGVVEEKGALWLSQVVVSSDGDVTALVTNRGKSTIDYYEVHCDFFDAGGLVIDHDFTNGLNLRPGETARVGRIHNMHAADLASYRCYPQVNQ